MSPPKDETNNWSGLRPREDVTVKQVGVGKTGGTFLPPQNKKVLLLDPGRDRGRTSSSSQTVLQKGSSLEAVGVICLT